MPTVTKVNPPADKVKKKRGRPKGSKNSTLNNKMYTFRCAKGCEAQFMSKNAEASCGTHRLWMELVV